ncbi:MAG: hypothetical protein RIC87_12495 [Kiloniellales bacterium]
MKMQGKVRLCRLYERTSANGNRYFTGRLGGAKVIVFRDQKAEADCPVWQVYLEDAESGRGASAGRSPPNPRKTAQTAAMDAQRPLDDGLPDDLLPVR